MPETHASCRGLEVSQLRFDNTTFSYELLASGFPYRRLQLGFSNPSQPTLAMTTIVESDFLHYFNRQLTDPKVL